MLKYEPHPTYPMAQALLDFWQVLDIKLQRLTRPTVSVLNEKLGLISDYILARLLILEDNEIPLPLNPMAPIRAIHRGKI